MSKVPIKLYTGYFAQMKKYEEAGCVPVSIALYTPAFARHIDSLKMLAPSSAILNAYKRNDILQDDYKKFYVEQLNKKVNWFKVLYMDIPDILEAHKDEELKGLVLCCYERPESFCHRHILADFIKSKFGVEVEEFEV